MSDYLKLFDTCPYAFKGEKSILAERHLGICADIASVLTPPASVSALDCFQGCPYTNTAFDFDIRYDGERVKCEGWTWLPNAILREGKTDAFSVRTLTAMIPAERGIVHKVTLTNLTAAPLTMPLAVAYRGRTRREEKWSFSIPKAGEDCRDNYEAEPHMLSSVADGAAYRLTASLDGMTMFRRAYLWETELTLPAAGTVEFYFSAHMGEEKKCEAEARAALGRYEEKIEASFAYLQKEVARIEAALPRFSSDCPALDRLYDRSLVTYILCRWENPDLCVTPYFSTGSVNGSCMCSYLWDYCGGLALHPIYDAEANRRQLLFYLKNDLTNSYALNPVTAAPVGPWYPINQEKIILMVYHHVLVTGDKDFLFERAGERTVLEWMKYHAYVCDDVSREVELHNYGKEGKHHLELFAWGNRPYDGVMPDLNARRYMNYMRAYELTVLADEPDEELPKRAAALKEKLKVLWNEREKWYDFIDADGVRGTMYTVQMFKFLTSGVIDAHEREGLISHLNEREFLSKFGLHSLSKTDPEYDQDDIDNGGGGICTHFAMHICLQLYATGYDKIATDILRRVYWWGERLPYLGDSCAANMVQNRDLTPLQGDISSTACAQAIFYGVFGISPRFDGSVAVCPARHRSAERMKVENARLCGKTFSVEIEGGAFTVTVGNKRYRAAVGETVVIR